MYHSQKLKGFRKQLLTAKTIPSNRISLICILFIHPQKLYGEPSHMLIRNANKNLVLQFKITKY